jgi:hypothetical protein
MTTMPKRPLRAAESYLLRWQGTDKLVLVTITSYWGRTPRCVDLNGHWSGSDEMYYVRENGTGNRYPVVRPDLRPLGTKGAKAQ